jgi:hypothetical protein
LLGFAFSIFLPRIALAKKEDEGEPPGEQEESEEKA